MVPTGTISVLLLFSLRNLEVNQDGVSDNQEVREEGGGVEFG